MTCDFCSMHVLSYKRTECRKYVINTRLYNLPLTTDLKPIFKSVQPSLLQPVTYCLLFSVFLSPFPVSLFCFPFLPSSLMLTQFSLSGFHLLPSMSGSDDSSYCVPARLLAD